MFFLDKLNKSYLIYVLVSIKIDMVEVVLTQLGIVCALGEGASKILDNVRTDPLCGMKTCKYDNIETVFGTIEDLADSSEDIRANLIIKKALDQLDIDRIKSKYRPERIGVVLGLTNTGVGEAQAGINQFLDSGSYPKNFNFNWLNLYTPTEYLKKTLDIRGPSYTISTACSSSAKAFSSSRSLIQKGVCDCMIVGGVDSWCSFAISGFHSLEALSKYQTIPMSKNRSGINLGEGACLFVMEKEDNCQSGIKLKGVGQSSDAWHITSPDPEGKGAIQCMNEALNDSGLEIDDIDYINLHGTGTAQNDSMEAKAVKSIFKDKNVLCSSTKPLTGHTLGASGALEVGLATIMLENNCLFPHVYDGQYDPDIERLNLVDSFCKKDIKNIMSNSYGFAGSNVSVIIGK